MILFIFYLHIIITLVAIIVRALLAEFPAYAIGRTRLHAETGLAADVFNRGIDALVAAHGVRILPHPNGLATDAVVWMPRINTITHIGAQFPWVTRWYNKAKFANMPARLQVRANLRATLRGGRKFI